MSKKQFKAESKKLLDMMINSIYTHKEIFLRELISNASDAIDKLYYKQLTDKITGLSRDDFEIRLTLNKAERTLTISDNGIGMNLEELENNLGTIAKSGSFDFKNENEAKDNIDIIGQFGVGFYSAFMVSDSVRVISKKYGEDKAYMWISEGADGYTVEETEKADCGTDIILHIKDNTDDENYEEFLSQYHIQSLVKKYSDYITYPIHMMFESTVPVEKPETDNSESTDDAADNSDAPEFETVYEDKVLNSMVPIWKKNKSELSDEDYNSYYKDHFGDFADPVCHIHTRVDGNVTYDALMYVPSKPRYDYYTKDFKSGLALYTNGVMIMDRCEELLPDYFNFVSGVVDSADLSLNISRELLQHDRQLKVIAKNIEKKIKTELENLQEKDRDKYADFFDSFGTQIKYGIYESFGMNKDKLASLLVYRTSMDDSKITLKEYIERMRDGQDEIYYATGQSVDRIKALPQTEAAIAKGYEVLFMTDPVDEFVVQVMRDFDGKVFKNISASDFDLSTDEEKEEIKKENEAAKSILKVMKEALDGKVKDVRFTSNLAKYPASLTNEGEISIEMEKTLKAMPLGSDVKAEVVLDINASHPVAGKIKSLEGEEDKIKDYAKILYNLARMISGLPVEDASELSELVCELM